MLTEPRRLRCIGQVHKSTVASETELRRRRNDSRGYPNKAPLWGECGLLGPVGRYRCAAESWECHKCLGCGSPPTRAGTRTPTEASIHGWSRLCVDES